MTHEASGTDAAVPQSGRRGVWKFARALRGPESSVFDLPRTTRAFRWTLDAMWEETARLNLFDLAPALEMPVFFFLGRNDHWVPPEAGLACFEALKAPRKELVWFEHSGHEPFVDEPAKFNAVMTELVLPVARAVQIARR